MTQGPEIPMPITLLPSTRSQNAENAVSVPVVAGLRQKVPALPALGGLVALFSRTPLHRSALRFQVSENMIWGLGFRV
jgi:hypothetical protein